MLDWRQFEFGEQVVVDKFSKMGHFIPTHTTACTEERALLFVHYIISQHGIPTTIISDQDPKVTSKFWKELMSLLETKLVMSSAYYPLTNGQTERLNQIVEQLLRAACKDDISKLDLHLPILEFAYDNATHIATRQIPFYCCYGCNPLTPQKPTAPATCEMALPHPSSERTCRSSFHGSFFTKIVHEAITTIPEPYRRVVARLHFVLRTVVTSMWSLHSASPTILLFLR
ncbi:hypothetical protein CLOM_g10164 [Closterium sp. NIES-68]|nr:hypothetical protein CLOM_g10164 [Closterium sp. NIES-68]